MAGLERHVAFLGGINVGGHRVTMDRLRDEVTRLGFADVSTFIASGNVVFSADVDGMADGMADGSAANVIEDIIADGLAAALGWPVPTFVRSAAALAVAVDLQPFGELADGTTHMILFCRSEPDRAIEQLSNDHERWEVHGADVHWLIRGGVSDSVVTLAKLPRLLGQPCTSRNTKGMRRLAALLR